jgi:hypothetical protein
MEKTIDDIRKSFREKYNNYANDLVELNKLIGKLAKEVDEILSFMDAAIKAKEEIGIEQ